MPSIVPRSREPYKQRELLARRVVELQSAIRSVGPSPRLSKAAERVRSAVLGVNKARRSIIAAIAEQKLWETDDGSPVASDSLKRQFINLDQEAERWASLSVEEIVAEYAAPDAS